MVRLITLIGTYAIADPYWVQKVLKNETYDIVPCIGCNEAYTQVLPARFCIVQLILTPLQKIIIL